MEETEKIYDKDLLNLLKALQNNKTLINIDLPGKDYECLSMITRIQTMRRNPCFVIDYPQGFKEAVADTEDLEMSFEFTGEDKVSYSFRTSDWEICRDGIRVKIPEFIYRIQRRKDFRIDVPPATKLHVKEESTLLQFAVRDISMGGTLIVLVGPEACSKKDTIFKVGEYLKDIELVFPLEGKDFQVHIEKAVAVRLHEDTPEAKSCCALQFVGMEEKEEKALTEFIYKYQRFLLKRK